MAPYPGMSQAYQPGYRPLQIPSQFRQPSGQINEETLNQIIKKLVEDQKPEDTSSIWDAFGEKEAATPASASSGGSASVGAGGAGYALNSALSSQPAATAGANALFNAGAEASTLGANTAGLPLSEGANTLFGGGQNLLSLGEPVQSTSLFSGGGAGAASAAGGPQGVLSGTSGLSYWGGPAAFIASAPLWAPKVGNAGDWAAKKVFGFGNKKSPREYKSEDVTNSPLIKNNLPGFDKLSPEKQKNLADKLKADDFLLTRGKAGDEGKTTPDKAYGINFNKFAGGASNMKQEKELETKFGKYWRNTASLDDILGSVPASSLKKEGYDKLKGLSQYIKDGGQGQTAPEFTGQAPAKVIKTNPSLVPRPIFNMRDMKKLAL